MSNRSFLPRPRVFLSYSREDAALAARFFAELEAHGLRVYMDTERTLVGDKFVEVIMGELRSCDAVLALLSPAAAKSEWCQAELTCAHALGRAVVPVRLYPQTDLSLTAPLAALQSSIQYTPLESEDGFARAIAAVRRRFRETRRRVAMRFLTRTAAVAVSVATLGWGLQSGVGLILRARERAAVVQRIFDIKAVLAREEIVRIASSFRGDESLRGQLLAISTDSQLPVHPRLNAKLLSAALSAGEGRWFLKDLDWSQSDWSSGSLTEATFYSGSISDATVTRVSFGGVVWGEPLRFGLSGGKFLGCRFFAGDFVATKVISTDFVNCIFDGTRVNLTNFGAVRFYSQRSEPGSEVITGGEQAIFERVTFQHDNIPLPPTTIDFGGPKNEVQFQDVVFENCEFRGFVRPEWFVRCNFSKCTFPPGGLIGRIEATGNTLHACTEDAARPQ